MSFLEELYECSGTSACDTPTWEKKSTPNNISEQAPGECSCGLHVVSQIILVNHNMWLTHTFDEGDIDILRLRIVDAMIRDGMLYSNINHNNNVVDITESVVNNDVLYITRQVVKKK